MTTTTGVPSWVIFGPDSPITSLPADFSGCLGPGNNSANCDAIVGSMLTGTGYCGPVTANNQQSYSQQSYCACVNNTLPCPQESNSYCANNAMAYRPSDWEPAVNAACAAAAICVNSEAIPGSNNIINGVVQKCDSHDSTVTVDANTLLVIALIICVILCLMSVGFVIGDKKKAAAAKKHTYHKHI